MIRGREGLKMYLSTEMEMLCAVPHIPGAPVDQQGKDLFPSSNPAILHMMTKIKASFAAPQTFSLRWNWGTNPSLDTK